MWCAPGGFTTTRPVVGWPWPLQSPTRQLLAHDHFPTRIHSDEVKAALAEIHSDLSNTVIVRSDVSHGGLLFANQLRFGSIAIHSAGARPVHTIIRVDGTELTKVPAHLRPGVLCTALSPTRQRAIRRASSWRAPQFKGGIVSGRSLLACIRA